MNPPASDQLERRVLVLAPTARDAEITRALLERAGLAAVACPDLRAFTRAFAAGAGAALITEDAVVADGVDELLTAFANQPAWSELPVVMLMRGGSEESDVPLDGYDDLTAAEIAARVKDLEPERLRAIRDYERRNANRKTVLSAVEQHLRS